MKMPNESDGDGGVANAKIQVSASPMGRRVTRKDLQRFGYIKSLRDEYAGRSLQELMEEAAVLKRRGGVLAEFVASFSEAKSEELNHGCWASETHAALEFWSGKFSKQSPGGLEGVAGWLLLALLSRPDLVDRLAASVSDYCEAEGLDQLEYLKATVRAQKRYRRTRAGRA
jgi:hypothetical protein